MPPFSYPTYRPLRFWAGTILSILLGGTVGTLLALLISNPAAAALTSFLAGYIISTVGVGLSIVVAGGVPGDSTLDPSASRRSPKDD